MFPVKRGSLSRYDHARLTAGLGLLHVDVVEVIEQLLVMHLPGFREHFEDDIDPGLFPVKQLSELRGSGGAAKPSGKESLRRLEQPAGGDERLIVTLRSFGLCQDVVHGRADGVDQPGMEPTMGGTVVLDGGNQSDGALLEEVTEGDATIFPGMRRIKHQIKVVLDQPLVRSLTLAPLGRKEASLFVAGQAWIARHLGAIIILLVLSRSRR